jgi:hypothetical protein
MDHLLWPADHRLAHQPMDMAYELLAWTLPLADPTPTFTPTPVPSSTPILPEWVTLTLDSVGGGDATANPEQDAYEPGSVVTLNAKADGVRFTHWSGDVPAGNETANPLDLVMDTNKSLTAHFEPATWTLEVSAEHGTVTVDPLFATYADKTTVQLTANFEPGYVFDYWHNQLGPLTEEQRLSNPLTLVIEDNMILGARARIDDSSPTPTATPAPIEDQWQIR